MARKFRITKRTPLWVVVLLLVVAIGQQYNWWQPIKDGAVANQPGQYKVLKDVDGDTIVVDMNGKQETIRLIGVDTPETHDPRKNVQCYGVVAASYTKRTLTGNSVRLQADQKTTDRDRYGRLLRYVYLPDGSLFNQTLISEGYGFYYPYFPFTKQTEFSNAQKDAQNAKKGLWGQCTPASKDGGGYTSNDQ